MRNRKSVQEARLRSLIKKRAKQNIKWYRNKRRMLFPFDKLSYRLYNSLCSHRFQAIHTPLDLNGYRVLVIAPHQDDETLGCGGFLLSCREQAEVQVIFMTSGKGPAELRSEEQRTRLASIRQKEAREVCRAFGAKDPINLGFDGPDLDDNDLVVQRLSEEISKFSPHVIMAPFFTDANWEHLWTTKNLAKVAPAICPNSTVLLYRAHGLISRRFQNVYFGLTDDIHVEKEHILSLFKSQKLDVDIMREKYLLYSTVVPRPLNARFRSIERFCSLSFSDFVALDCKYGTDPYLYKFRSINYVPYSFRCYVMNELASKMSPFCKKGPDMISHGAHFPRIESM